MHEALNREEWSTERLANLGDHPHPRKETIKCTNYQSISLSSLPPGKVYGKCLEKRCCEIFELKFEDAGYQCFLKPFLGVKMTP